MGGEDGWARYAIKDINEVIIFQDRPDPRKSANAYVNPLTACGQIDFAKSQNANLWSYLLLLLSWRSNYQIKQYNRLNNYPIFSVIG
ncbi:UNKNOWN [Stylonychia lemnae]|uniref:Uncharacterized protein n=1 Tax=Stylonychia lemnae TaxID=5949 RepID=A0A077ZQ93_STYLE|nr:UNKNOWN [Stylonychia lemnae]|eukprot:CDW71560.1 UNKNOWN [Stylonychia lemnae]